MIVNRAMLAESEYKTMMASSACRGRMKQIWVIVHINDHPAFEPQLAYRVIHRLGDQSYEVTNLQDIDIAIDYFNLQEPL